MTDRYFWGSPGAPPWNDCDARGQALDAEEARDRRWARFEDECVEFAEAERDGWAAVLRAVARAMAAQGELLK